MIMNRAMVCTLTNLRNDIQMFKISREPRTSGDKTNITDLYIYKGPQQFFWDPGFALFELRFGIFKQSGGEIKVKWGRDAG